MKKYDFASLIFCALLLFGNLFVSNPIQENSNVKPSNFHHTSPTNTPFTKNVTSNNFQFTSLTNPLFVEKHDSIDLTSSIKPKDKAFLPNNKKQANSTIILGSFLKHQNLKYGNSANVSSIVETFSSRLANEPNSIVTSKDLTSSIQFKDLDAESHSDGRDSYIIDFGFYQEYTISSLQTVFESSFGYLKLSETAYFGLKVSIPINITFTYDPSVKPGELANVSAVMYEVEGGAAISIPFGFTLQGDFSINTIVSSHSETFLLYDYSDEYVIASFPLKFDPHTIFTKSISLNPAISLIPYVGKLTDSLFDFMLHLSPAINISINTDVVDSEENYITSLAFDSYEPQTFSVNTSQFSFAESILRFEPHRVQMDFFLSLIWEMTVGLTDELSFVKNLLGINDFTFELFTFPQLKLPIGLTTHRGSGNIFPVTTINIDEILTIKGSFDYFGDEVFEISGDLNDSINFDKIDIFINGAFHKTFHGNEYSFKDALAPYVGPIEIKAVVYDFEGNIILKKVETITPTDNPDSNVYVESRNIRLNVWQIIVHTSNPVKSIKIFLSGEGLDNIPNKKSRIINTQVYAPGAVIVNVEVCDLLLLCQIESTSIPSESQSPDMKLKITKKSSYEYEIFSERVEGKSFVHSVDYYINNQFIESLTKPPFLYKLDTRDYSGLTEISFRAEGFGKHGMNVSKLFTLATKSSLPEFNYTFSQLLLDAYELTITQTKGSSPLSRVQVLISDQFINEFNPNKGSYILNTKGFRGTDSLLVEVIVFDEAGQSASKTNEISFAQTRPDFDLKVARIQSNYTLNAEPKSKSLVSKIKFYVNGKLVKIDDVFPFSHQIGINDYQDSEYLKFKAVAFSKLGDYVVVEESRDIMKPTIEITEINSELLSSSNSETKISTLVTVTDNGQISSVEAYLNKIYQKTYRIFPVNHDFIVFGEGSYVLKFVTFDAEGNFQTIETRYIVDYSNPRIELDINVDKNSVDILARAFDNFEIDHVKFYDDKTYKWRDSFKPYKYSFIALEGSYIIKVKAYDSAGNFVEISEMLVVDYTPPVVRDIEIHHFTTWFGLGSQKLNIKAIVTDNVAVDKVEFYKNGIYIGTDNEGPYEYETSADDSGSYKITIIVYDLNGNSTDEMQSYYVP